MAEDEGGAVFRSSGGGIAGEHPAAKTMDAFVGPSTSGQTNTIRMNLVPIACWRVEDMRFDFDSSNFPDREGPRPRPSKKIR